jgi:hypothetical protein
MNTLKHYLIIFLLFFLKLESLKSNPIYSDDYANKNSLAYDYQSFEDESLETSQTNDDLINNQDNILNKEEEEEDEHNMLTETGDQEIYEKILINDSNIPLVNVNFAELNERPETNKIFKGA